MVGFGQRAGAAEGEWHLGAKAGIATLSGADPGPALGAHAAYGLSDLFDVTAEFVGSRQTGANASTVLSGTAGLVYKVDVFEWIPYVGLLVGYYHFGGSGEHSGSAFGGAAQLGVDYLVSRDFALGADVRFHGVLQDSEFRMPYFTALVGGEYRFGY